MGLFRRQTAGDVAVGASVYSISTSGSAAAPASTPSPPARLASLKTGLSRALSRSLTGAPVPDESREGTDGGGSGATDEARAAASLTPAPGLRRVKSRVSDDFPLLLTPQSPKAPPSPAAPPSPQSRWHAAIERCVDCVAHKIIIKEPSVHGGKEGKEAGVTPAVAAAASAFLAAAHAADADPADRAAAVADDEVRKEIHFSGGSARLLGRAASRGCLVAMDDDAAVA